jgi:hypothetical protein
MFKLNRTVGLSIGSPRNCVRYVHGQFKSIINKNNRAKLTKYIYVQWFEIWTVLLVDELKQV